LPKGHKFLGGRVQSGGDVANFTPTKYLGTLYPSFRNGKSLLQESPDDFKACEELWGARHELLHNGRAQIREFDAATCKADRFKLRPLSSHELFKFRRSVMATIEWMKKA
jgi:hypothetical protein